MKPTFASGLVVLALSGCNRPGVDRGDQPIYGGVPTSEFPAVGYLQLASQACTATLIGERTLLTARHCIGHKLSGKPFETDDPATVEFFVTHDIHAEEEPIGIVASKLSAYPLEEGESELESDIAVVQLVSSPDPAIPRIALSTAVPEVAAPITLVGFGQTESGSSGQKRRAPATILNVTPGSLSFKGANNICFGDSGGPSLLTEGEETRVVGVHSYINGSCGEPSQVGNDMRVDAHLDWIVEAAEGDVLVEGGVIPDAGTTEDAMPGRPDAGTTEDAMPGTPDASTKI